MKKSTKRKRKLTLPLLKKAAIEFSQQQSLHHDPFLFGVTDGKAVGTYFEHKFQKYISETCRYEMGSSAKGIDFPELNIDMKVTSIKQPQSSCPFRSARQKIYGLGYSLLIFAYDKSDNHDEKTGCLDILHTIFVEASHTADFQTTSGIRQILENEGNIDDMLAFFEERLLPLDEIGANQLANEVLQNPPELGYLTISNALQWRLQYRRVIGEAGSVEGIERLS